MTRNVIGMLWIAIATTSCPDLELFQTAPVEAIEPSAVPPAGMQPYGVDGELSEADIKALLYLRFPQSYEAISGRFGFPAYRDSVSDYYKLPNGRWVVIQYAGKTATGLKFSDSGD
ncbi:hypothetical protein N836_24500 [Leptolyngbya sp. Heron Island J]|uniref:hypothetical protein n=1 Tax=Leptolyngbya sp. Heron Island J TaxID=1385935 RepID=UPI0003B989BF|nr:hypothetical protein [Leptolyngbya sp. Heron Island J]ESA32775.1 hypothetical protein N836_24500 [Leptolyngbya sp. Heron Island J]